MPEIPHRQPNVKMRWRWIRGRCLLGLLVVGLVDVSASWLWAQEFVPPPANDSSILVPPKLIQPKPIAPHIVNLTGLRASIERARSSLIAHRLPKPDEARQRLVAEMKIFEAYLGGPDSTNAQAWFKFLKWSDLQEQVAAKEPDLRILNDVAKSFRQNVKGFEYSPYLSMRTSIEKYIDAERFGANSTSTLKALDSRLSDLLALIESSSELSDQQRARELGLTARYLASSNQTPELISAIRGYYSQPNLRVSVPESMVNRALSRPVNQPNPVDECVLGTRVLGNSFISGNVFADLIPQNNGISVRLNLAANFSSDNVGYNRGVKVYTTGSSPVHASKQITIGPSGTFSQPAVASTNLQTQINSIEHRFRLVRRIASRKAAQQKPEANAIGQYRLQSRLAQQFNDQIEQQLQKSNVRLDALNQNRVEMTRLGLPQPTWGVQSTDSQVIAHFKEVDSLQFAAPAGVPISSSSNEIVAEVHQSLPINIAETVLSARTVHSWEMDDLVGQYTEDVPAELIKESQGEPWSVTFVEHNPLEIEFEDGLVTASLRISKLARGPQELRDTVTVSAGYKPIVSNGLLMFERQGEVNLDFAKSPRGLRAVALRTFFKGKFDKLFVERSKARSLTIPTKMPNVAQLVITRIDFRRGWAQVSMR